MKETTKLENEHIQQWLEQDEENVNLFLKLKKIYENDENLQYVDSSEIALEWNTIESKLDTPRKKRRLFPMSSVLLVASIFIACIIGTLFFTSNSTIPSQSYTTNSGQKHTIQLSDGTTVCLNAKSRLFVEENFGNKNRKVSLEGEAWFDIAHDSNSQFIVSTNDIQVSVHGTTFNVDAYPWNENVITSLEKGSISLRCNGTETFMQAGDIASITKSNHEIHITHKDNNVLSSWRQNVLVFDNQPLKNILIELENHYGVEIECPKANKVNDRIRLTLEGETVQEALSILEMVTEIEFKVKNKSKREG